MNENPSIGQKVKIQRKGESGTWQECGRGIVMDINNGKDNDFIRYWDSTWPEGVLETIPINASCMRVVKW